MSTLPPAVPAGDLPREHTSGLSIDVSGDDEVDRRLAEIETAGEEATLGYGKGARPHLAAEVRYLICGESCYLGLKNEASQE